MLLKRDLALHQTPLHYRYSYTITQYLNQLTRPDQVILLIFLFFYFDLPHLPLDTKLRSFLRRAARIAAGSMLHRVQLLQQRIPASCIYIHPCVPLFHTSGLIFTLVFFFLFLIINTTKHDNQIGFTTVFQLNFLLDSFMLTFLCFSFLRKKKRILFQGFHFSSFLPSFPPSTEWKQEVLVSGDSRSGV